MRIPAVLMPHQVILEKFTGATPTGKKFAAPSTIRAQVKDEQRIVQSSDGSQLVSNTNVMVDVENYVPPLSKVTVWATSPVRSPRTAAVIATEFLEGPIFPSVLLFLE